MNKKYGSVYGLMLGFTAIIGSFLIEGGSIRTLFLIPPILIVFGGTFAAVIVGYGIEKFAKILSLVKFAYFPREYDPNKMINVFVQFSMKVRQFGLLSIEKEIEAIDFGFGRKMMGFLLTGTDTETLETIAYTEMKSMRDRHNTYIGIFTKMGSYAPTMGILGTVMALIMTLANAGSEPEVLIKNIATAFIATLWGVLSANLIWLPIADRLKKCHLEEQHMMEVTMEGVLALKNGEIPSIIKTRLVSLLPQREQEEILGY
ncbi:MAG: MotA/TolQ/ExbB proton channel family protein [Melioribacteraceae bacterium]|nr:MotA/TolQ/ExbB proton channel family protein [Melioribacteraceae bacterium]MCF8355163.1 MotA/TolQ/ExbB proton channel family protein [Melioribacteraceae bacterium]MCF8392492.1 MotA/TolQ/ExbB proton channel family protein [Melioribacteraceae bacterium]MCF8418403.1 MotA/TolQ/ExbB proton channel family protein [Melioribacteraceae bacterium]